MSFSRSRIAIFKVCKHTPKNSSCCEIFIGRSKTSQRLLVSSSRVAGVANTVEGRS